MLKKLSTLPFNGTAEQKAKLDAFIEANKSDKSRLMAVMQEAQGIYGYLPIEVQQIIAEGMEVPLEKVYGISTFYAQSGKFALQEFLKVLFAYCTTLTLLSAAPRDGTDGGRWMATILSGGSAIISLVSIDLLSTHIFSLVEKLCDRVGVIIGGRMVACDTLTAVCGGMSLEDRFFELYKSTVGEEV